MKFADVAHVGINRDREGSNKDSDEYEAARVDLQGIESRVSEHLPEGGEEVIERREEVIERREEVTEPHCRGMVRTLSTVVEGKIMSWMNAQM